MDKIQPIWRTATEEIPMDQLSDEHLQHNFQYCEQRYMFHNNEAVRKSLEAERLERSASKSVKSSQKFHELIAELKKEGKRRNMPLVSLCEGAGNKNKYQILRNLHKVIT